MNCKATLLLAGILMGVTSQAQKAAEDTMQAKNYLPDLTVVGRHSYADIHQLPEVVGTHIFAGKKNALVVIDNVNGNVVTNTMRQVLAKVPGIHIWESDGSGIQIGIASRGLSPNRSWDFNVRQNGYDISADPFGYPEAYYHPPLQAVQRVQIVKGAGSLQYGPQFGGVVNYVIRNGSEINKPFLFETYQTAGSFGLINSFNAIGGQGKKDHYYAFFDHRNADGWRDNSRYKTNTVFGNYNYKFNDKWTAGVELMHYDMLSQQPGGLTDSQFAVSARQSFRSRNWFNLDWTTGAANIDYSINENNKLNLKVSAMRGYRNSIGYLGNISQPDTINAATNSYNNRQVDVDKYVNTSAELRYLSNYKLGKMKNTATLSARYFHGNTDRQKGGKGDTGTEFNTNIIGIYPTNITFNTDNVALAAENMFRISDRFMLIPGIRFESIQASANGFNGLNEDGTGKQIQDLTNNRTFTLLALAAEYQMGATELYGNITQAYRPIQFADITAAPTTDIIDPNLKDAKGYNADLGYRGKLGSYFLFDASAFYLSYDNRIGTITQMRPDLSTYNFKTNVGSSSSKGVEAMAEFNPFKAGWLNSKNGEISMFVSYSYTDAAYNDFKVITKDSDNKLVEKNLKNKRVENAPKNIVRTGLTYSYHTFALTGQLSYVSSTFSDANNTITPSSSGTTGLIPSYTVGDVTASYRYHDKYTVKAGVNNVADTKYFTRRAGGYPGPGLMPADGRSFFVTVGAKF